MTAINRNNSTVVPNQDTTTTNESHITGKAQEGSTGSSNGIEQDSYEGRGNTRSANGETRSRNAGPNIPSPQDLARGNRIISHGGASGENWDVNRHYDSPDMPSGALTTEVLDQWIQDNFEDPSQVAATWREFSYDYNHMMDAYAYSVLDSFASGKAVCRENALNNTYMLNNMGLEAHAIAYAEPDCFHVITIFQDEDGSWKMMEYNTIHDLEADSYEEALAEAMPSTMQYWEWSKEDAGDQPYVERVIRTKHGLDVERFINGQDFEGSGTNVATDKISAGVELGAGFRLDAQHNLGDTWGPANNATMLAVRRDFGDHFNMGLSYGYFPEFSTRRVGSSDMETFPMHMVALGANWDANLIDQELADGDLRIRTDLEGALGVPVMFFEDGQPEYGGMLLQNTQLDTDITTQLEYDPLDQVTLSASHTAHVDAMHTAMTYVMAQRMVAPPISQFTTAGIDYHPVDGLNLGANVYMPLAIYDTRFAEDPSWNTYAAYQINEDLSAHASLTGNFTENPINRVEAGLDYKNFTLSAYGSQLNSPQPEVGASFAYSFSY